MAQLSAEMLLLLEKVTEKLNEQTNTITETVTSAVLQKVEEKIKPVIEENEKLKIEVEKLNKQVGTLEVSLKRNNVILHGIEEPKEGDENEDLAKTAISTLSEIGVVLIKEEIDRVTRLGKIGEKTEKIRPILLTTTTLQKKIEIMKNKSKMKTGTYITKDLTREALQQKKENKTLKLNEKRKRSADPIQDQIEKNNEQKIKKIDAFQHMRERSYSLSEKNTYKNS